MSEERPHLVPLGGFLGAGKTSLIVAAARVLAARGLHAAAILNDQGSELVDHAIAEASGVASDQVAGGCFCCRFTDLIDTAMRLREHRPHVIFAEAVGSCTDLAATVLEPLRTLWSGSFRLAPLTVLVDPERAGELESASESDMGFLFRNQLAEADLVCFSKADRYTEFPSLEGVAVRYLSARTGQGVGEWLDEILADGQLAGTRKLQIDYERYARAEAALAWLNCRAEVRPSPATSPALLVGPLLDRLDSALIDSGLQVVHLKLMDESSVGWIKAALVRSGEEPAVEGMLDASPAAVHHLLLNIRAVGSPVALRRVVEAELERLPGRIALRGMECFSPAAPNPEYRAG